MNAETATAQIAAIETQSSTLKAQLTVADDLLRSAAAQGDLGAAKFALGMISGALVAASPEEDRYALMSSAIDASRAPLIDPVLDTFVWMSRRGYELMEDLDQNIRRIRFSAELDY